MRQSRQPIKASTRCSTASTDAATAAALDQNGSDAQPKTVALGAAIAVIRRHLAAHRTRIRSLTGFLGPVGIFMFLAPEWLAIAYCVVAVAAIVAHLATF